MGRPKTYHTEEEKRLALNERNRRWRKENPEKQKAKEAKYRPRYKERKRQRQKEYYQQNREYYLAKQREANLLNPDRARSWVYKTRYGITLEIFRLMMQRQEGKCLICREEMKTPCVDHCHETGKARGLLCRFCNMGIAALKENPTIMQRAIQYVQAWKKIQT